MLYNSKECHADFPIVFYWYETVDKEPDLGKLWRGPYLGMPSFSAAERENPDVTSFERYVHKQIGASFVPVQVFAI